METGNTGAGPDAQGEPVAVEETIIEFTYNSSQQSPWESDADSATSTPDYKRGKHTEAKVCQEVSDDQAIREMLQDGLQQQAPGWMQKKRQPSLTILADSQLENWPGQDAACTLEYRKG